MYAICLQRRHTYILCRWTTRWLLVSLLGRLLLAVVVWIYLSILVLLGETRKRETDMEGAKKARQGKARQGKARVEQSLSTCTKQEGREWCCKSPNGVVKGWEAMMIPEDEPNAYSHPIAPTTQANNNPNTHTGPLIHRIIKSKCGRPRLTETIDTKRRHIQKTTKANPFRSEAWSIP